MKLFNLPKKYEMKFRQVPFVHDDNWISNGHFMVKKEIIKDFYKYCGENEDAKANLGRIVPQDINILWKKTNRIIDKGDAGYLRIFICEDTEEEVFFNDDYINHFKIQTLKGSCENNPFISDDEKIVIMSIRNNNTNVKKGDKKG